VSRDSVAGNYVKHCATLAAGRTKALAAASVCSAASLKQCILTAVPRCNLLCNAHSEPRALKQLYFTANNSCACGTRSPDHPTRAPGVTQHETPGHHGIGLLFAAESRISEFCCIVLCSVLRVTSESFRLLQKSSVFPRPKIAVGDSTSGRRNHATTKRTTRVTSCYLVAAPPSRVHIEVPQIVVQYTQLQHCEVACARATIEVRHPAAAL